MSFLVFGLISIAVINIGSNVVVTDTSIFCDDNQHCFVNCEEYGM